MSARKRGGFGSLDGFDADDRIKPDTEQLFIVERRETENGPAVKVYPSLGVRPFASRGLADYISKRVSEAHPEHVVVVVPLDPEERDGLCSSCGHKVAHDGSCACTPSKALEAARLAAEKVFGEKGR